VDLLHGGLLSGAGLFSWSYAEYSYFVADQPPPLAHFVAWVGSWFWYPLLGTLLMLPLLLFPDGLLSRRWRPVLWLAIGSIVAVTALAATPTTFVVGEGDGTGQGMRLEGPIGLFDARQVENLPVFSVFGILVLVITLLGVVSLVTRFRRSHGRERLQMKWFMYAAALMFVNLAVGMAVPAFDESAASTVLFVVAIAALPLSCGVAIVRHRLYDIDLIINRTLVYGTMTAILLFAYLGLVVLLQQLLAPLTEDSDLAVAASTLAVAALFRPLRAAVQGFIDRRFYRSKYDAAATLGAFSVRLRDQVDLDSLGRELVAVVGTTMQPVHASLWLRIPEETR